MGMIQNCRCKCKERKKEDEVNLQKKLNVQKGDIIVNNLSNLKKLDLNLEKLFNKRIKIEEKKEDEISENFNSEEENDYNLINVISIRDNSFIKE
jgi:hypothetical protein